MKKPVAPIPYFVAGQQLTAQTMNRLIDAINEQLGWVVCAHCRRTHREPMCPGCGAPRPEDKEIK